MTTPSDATNVASYAWYADGVAISGATEASYVVKASDEGKKIKVAVTDTEGTVFESAESSAVAGEDLSAEVKITDEDGLQADGTAAPTDTFQLTYGSTLGTPKIIVWYRNGAAVGIYQDATLNTGFKNSDFTDGTISASMASGEWYVTIENTAGQVFVSNSIVVAEAGVAALSNVSFTEDYETPALDYATTTTKYILNVTLNKAYGGGIFIFGGEEENFKVADVVSGNTHAAPDYDTANATACKKASEFVDSKVDAATNDILSYVDPDTGAVSYKILVNEDALTRGSKYTVVFDQDDIDDDDVKTTANDKVNKYEAVEAPYLVAPASIVATSFKTGETTSEVTFYDAEGNVLEWITGAASANAAGFASVNMYSNTSNTNTGGTRVANVSEAISKGVAKLTHAGIATNYAYATAITTKGIYGEKAVTLTSVVAESATDPAESVVLSESETDAKDAVATFKNLKTAASGKAYLFQGSGDNDTFAEIGALEDSKAIASVDVAGGSTTVTFDDVFSKVDSTAAKNMFVVKFVPTDNLTWATMKAGASSSTVFTLTQKATSLEYDPSATAIAAEDITAESGDGTTTWKLVNYDILDQFGDTVSGGTADVGETEATISAVNDGGAYKEDGTATYSIANDVVSITQKRVTTNSGIDYADGYKITVLGTDFTSYALVGGATTTNITYSLKSGDTTLFAGTVVSTGVTTYNQMKKALAAAAVKDDDAITVTLTGKVTIPAGETITVDTGDVLAVTNGATNVITNNGTLELIGTMTTATTANQMIGSGVYLLNGTSGNNYTNLALLDGVAGGTATIEIAKDVALTGNINVTGTTVKTIVDSAATVTDDGNETLTVANVLENNGTMTFDGTGVWSVKTLKSTKALAVAAQITVTDSAELGGDIDLTAELKVSNGKTVTIDPLTADIATLAIECPGAGNSVKIKDSNSGKVDTFTQAAAATAADNAVDADVSGTSTYTTKDAEIVVSIASGVVHVVCAGAE